MLILNSVSSGNIGRVATLIAPPLLIGSSRFSCTCSSLNTPQTLKPLPWPKMTFSHLSTCPTAAWVVEGVALQKGGLLNLPETSPHRNAHISLPPPQATCTLSRILLVSIRAVIILTPCCPLRPPIYRVRAAGTSVFSDFQHVRGSQCRTTINEMNERMACWLGSKRGGWDILPPALAGFSLDLPKALER